MSHLLQILLSVSVAAALGLPQDPRPKPAASTATTKPAIDQFAWLAGHWRGTGLGGVCEEIWSQPLAGTMVGSFRLVKDDEVVFYELMVLGPDADGVALKVKHFSKDFVAWEEKDGSVRFALESVKPNDARFSGLTLTRDGDELDIGLRMRSRDGKTRWERFELRRVDVNAKAPNAKK